MKNNGIVVLSEDDSADIFKSVGFDVVITNTENAEQNLRTLALSNNIIFVCDDLYKKLEKVIDEYKLLAKVMIVPIACKENDNYVKEKIMLEMKNSLGIDGFAK